MDPGILETFSYIWRMSWSQMGTLENHWLLFDPSVGKGIQSPSESGHS